MGLTCSDAPAQCQPGARPVATTCLDQCPGQGPTRVRPVPRQVRSRLELAKVD
jgi:hypothetical protein